MEVEKRLKQDLIETSMIIWEHLWLIYNKAVTLASKLVFTLLET